MNRFDLKYINNGYYYIDIFKKWFYWMKKIVLVIKEVYNLNYSVIGVILLES